MSLACALKIDFVLAKRLSADSDEMLHWAIHLGLHCLTKYPFWDNWSLKGLMSNYINSTFWYVMM